MSNPQLRLMNIPEVAAIAHGAGARLVVDNTFATPYCTRPLSVGLEGSEALVADLQQAISRTASA